MEKRQSNFIIWVKLLAFSIVAWTLVIRLVMWRKPELMEPWFYIRSGQAIMLVWLTLKWSSIATMAAPLASYLFPYLPESISVPIVRLFAWAKGWYKNKFHSAHALTEPEISQEERCRLHFENLRPKDPPTLAQLAQMHKNRREMERMTAKLTAPPPKPRGKTKEEAIQEALSRIKYGGIGK
jgi:hypothetical protein